MNAINAATNEKEKTMKNDSCSTAAYKCDHSKPDVAWALQQVICDAAAQCTRFGLTYEEAAMFVERIMERFEVEVK